MLKFTIPPEFCLIINAFNQATTLRGAAALLEMDPPALVRKVKKISSEFGYLQKVGHRWALTHAGRRVAQWTDEFMNSQVKLTQEKSQLRIAAFSWLAEEMLIPEFHRLSAVVGDDQSWSIKMTASNLEQELIHSRSDLVIQGHAPSDPAVSYKKISSFQWIVVVPYSWKKNIANLNEIQLFAFLQKKKFIRLLNMNSEQMLGFKPLNFSNLTVDGVAGLRAAVVSEHGWSVVPTMSVQSHLKDKKLYKLNVSTLVKDEVSVWWLRARKDMIGPAKVVAKWISEFAIE
jgi:DNA-binding transcriptional LysR family regulator